MAVMPAPERRAHEDEPLTERYARQTRNAVVFIAWIIGLGVTAALIIGIVAGVQLGKIQNELSSGGGSSSNCYSQGGTDLSC